jgi:hypothetical protein
MNKSLVNVSLVTLFGRKFVKIDNAHFNPSDINKVENIKIAVDNISDTVYDPTDYCSRNGKEYAFVEGTFTIFTDQGREYRLLNCTGGGKNVTTPEIKKSLFKSYEADAVKDFFEENCR